MNQNLLLVSVSFNHNLNIIKKLLYNIVGKDIIDRDIHNNTSLLFNDMEYIEYWNGVNVNFLEQLKIEQIKLQERNKLLKEKIQFKPVEHIEEIDKPVEIISSGNRVKKMF